MNGEHSFTSLDGIVLAVFVLAMVRGVFIGLVRESFSIAALAAAVLAARYGTDRASDWLNWASENSLDPQVGFWLAGCLIVICTIALVAGVGRLAQKGIRFAGLGWADRIGGAAIGATEGVIVSLLLVLGTTWALGRDHPAIEQSRSLEAYDVVRGYFSETVQDLPHVATPADWL